MSITVKRIEEWKFEVAVESQGVRTTHSVHVSDAYWKKLTGGKVPVERLVEKSFEFLLERESNSSILSVFDLSVIQRYFPDYERTISAGNPEKKF